MRAPVFAAALLACGCWDFDAALKTCASEGFPCLPMGVSPDGGGAMGTWQNVYTLNNPLPLYAVHAASKDEVYFAGDQTAVVHYLHGQFTEGYLGVLQCYAIGTDSQGFIFVGELGPGIISRLDAGIEWDGGELDGTLTTTNEPVTSVWNAGSQTFAGQNNGKLLQSPNWSPRNDAPALHELLSGWGSADNDFWFTGSDTADNTFAWHFNGSWGPGIGVPYLNSLWGSGPDDVWGVGLGGAVIRFHADGGLDTLDAGRTTWTAVWGTGPNDVFLAGFDGFVAHWDGRGFSRTSVSSFSLFSLHGSGPLDVWAVDSDGGIFHYGP